MTIRERQLSNVFARTLGRAPISKARPRGPATTRNTPPRPTRHIPLPACFYVPTVGHIKVYTEAGRESWRDMRAKGLAPEDIDGTLLHPDFRGDLWLPFAPLAYGGPR